MLRMRSSVCLKGKNHSAVSSLFPLFLRKSMVILVITKLKLRWLITCNSNSRPPAYRRVARRSRSTFSGLLRDFVVARGGKAMVRGLRAVSGFDYRHGCAGSVTYCGINPVHFFCAVNFFFKICSIANTVASVLRHLSPVRGLPHHAFHLFGFVEYDWKNYRLWFQ